MPFTETELKRHLKEAPPARLYLLYGREPYLTSHYADQVVRLAMGKDAGEDPLGQFNLQRFDGQDSSWDAIEEARLPPAAGECPPAVRAVRRRAVPAARGAG